MGIIQAYQGHNICILDRDLHALLAEKLPRYVDGGWSVFCARDKNWPFTAKALEKSGISVKDYLEDRKLILTPIKEIYSPSRIARRNIMASWEHLIRRTEKKTKLKGALIVGSNQVFFDTNNLSGLVACEKKGKMDPGILDIEVICTCEVNALSKLSLSQLISVLSSHSFAVQKRNQYQSLNNMQIMNMIRNALDADLGPGSSTLILRTLELIYHFDKNDIIAQPMAFENQIAKALGRNSEKRLNRLVSHMCNQLLFHMNGGK